MKRIVRSDVLEWAGAKVWFEVVTPDRAEQLLNTMKINRRVRRPRISGLIHDLESNNFHLTGAAIQLDDQGNLLDGQHRLHAVAASGKDAPFLFFQGLTRNALHDAVDFNTPRSLGDSHTLCGVKDAQLTASIQSRVLWLLNDNRTDRTKSKAYTMDTAGMPDYDEVVRRARYVVENSPYRRVLSVSLVGAMMHVYPEMADFIERVGTGIGIKRHSHEAMLCRQLLRLAEDGLPLRSEAMAQRVYYYFVRTWNRIKQGESPKKLVYSPKTIYPLLTEVDA